MAQRVRDILLRIRGDSSDAESDLHDLARDLKRFDQIKAEATVDINTQAADRKIASAKSAMQAFGRMSEEAKVDLQTRAADVKLQALRTNLENLQRKPVTPKVEIAIGRTVQQIERIEDQLDRLDRRRVDIDIDVDRRGILGAGVAGAGVVAGGLLAATEGLGLFISAASKGIPIIGGLGQLFIQLGLSGAALGPIMLALVPIMGVLLLGAVVLLTGAVASLVASLAAAAAGVGVLGIALAAAFGPVLLVGIAVMARLANVMKAVNETGEERRKLLEKMTPQEQRLTRTLIALKDTLTEIARPATSAVFAGLLDALDNIREFAESPRVRGGLTIIGRALGNALRVMSEELGRREVREAFADLAGGAARLIRILSGPVFRTVFRILLRIAQEALPWLEDVAESIGRAFRRTERAATRSKIKETIDGFKESFDAWWQVIKDVYEIVQLLLFPAGKRKGDSLAKQIHEILEDWKEWLRKNPDKIRKFFEDTAEWAKKVAQWIWRIVTRVQNWIEKNPDKIKAFFDAVKWSAQAVLDVVNGIVDGIKWLDEHKGPSGKEIYEESGIDKIKGPSLIDIIRGAFSTKPRLGQQTGGVIPGVGSGDIVPAMLEPGEYVIRRSVAQAIGVPRLNLLNAGNFGALNMSRGGDVNIGAINLPPAPGHDQLGDPRHQAVQLARELRRRGGLGLAGGGIG